MSAKTRPAVVVVDGTEERPLRSRFASQAPRPSSHRLEKKLFMSSKIDQIRAAGDASRQVRPRTTPSEHELDRKAFRIDAALIERLGASQLDNKRKKQYEAKMIMSLGGKAPKNIKTPINILKGMRQKQKQRQARQDEMDRAAGNLVMKRSDPQTSAQDRGVGLKIGVGQYRQGKLQISNRAIKQIESTPSEPTRLASLLKRKRNKP